MMTTSRSIDEAPTTEGGEVRYLRYPRPPRFSSVWEFLPQKVQPSVVQVAQGQRPQLR